MLVANQTSSTSSAARRLQSIPLPRGPQWYLVAYRWLVVAAGLYTTVVTWNVWQVRSGPGMELVPMLPAWDWLPQIHLGWLIVGSLLLVLVAPWTGIIAYSALVATGILLDQTRLQPPFFIMFLLLGTMPNINAQMMGRAYLISLWFWAGFHKLMIDFIKPADMFGFRSDIIPMDLAKHFPPDVYSWSTHGLGVAIGWGVSLGEIAVAIMCLIPATRRLVAVLALVMHLGIAMWHCPALNCSVLAWNVALALAGLALFLPWRESLRTSLKQCHIAIRALFALMLLYPAGYYLNWTNAYLSHCIYVPNTTSAMLYRPGDSPRELPFMEVDVTRLPLPPGHALYERYFDKIKQPGDVLVIRDPRPWARYASLDGRQLTDCGEFRNGPRQSIRNPDGTLLAEGCAVDDMAQGLWARWHPSGKLKSQGVLIDDTEAGPWSYWYPDGKKAMQGNYVKGQAEGTWRQWSPEGDELKLEFHNGEPVEPSAVGSEPITDQ